MPFLMLTNTVKALKAINMQNTRNELHIILFSHTDPHGITITDAAAQGNSQARSVSQSTYAPAW